MPSHSDHNTPMTARPRSRRAARAIVGLVAAWLLLGLTVHFSRTTLVEWAGNRAGLNWRIDQVEWSLSNRSLELHGIQIDDDSWMANTDTIACTGISWTKGVLHVDRIHLGTLDVMQTSNPRMKVAPSTRTLNSIGNPFGQAPFMGSTFIKWIGQKSALEDSTTLK